MVELADSKMYNVHAEISFYYFLVYFSIKYTLFAKISSPFQTNIDTNIVRLLYPMICVSQNIQNYEVHQSLFHDFFVQQKHN